MQFSKIKSTLRYTYYMYVQCIICVPAGVAHQSVAKHPTRKYCDFINPSSTSDRDRRTF